MLQDAGLVSVAGRQHGLVPVAAESVFELCDVVCSSLRERPSRCQLAFLPTHQGHGAVRDWKRLVQRAGKRSRELNDGQEKGKDDQTNEPLILPVLGYRNLCRIDAWVLPRFACRLEWLTPVASSPA